MRTERAAAVRVQLTPARRGIRVEFTAARWRVRPVRVTLPDTGRIAEVRRELAAGLTAVKKLLPALKIDDDRQLAKIAEELGSLGRRMVLILFGNQPAIIQQLQRFWNAAVPEWPNEARTAVVECLGDEDHLLPLEFLPLFDMAGCDKAVGGRESFVRACRSFVGFSCVVRRRILPLRIAPDSVIRAERDGRVVLRYLQDKDLRGAKTELDWLASEGGPRVRLLGPFPGAGLTLSELAAQIFDPSRSSTAQCHPDDIQHFSCHCYTNTGRPMDYALKLRGSDGDLRMTLGELGAKFVEQAALAPRARQPMPLVFLNACGSSKVDPVSSLSFPRLFIENGNRGFLGAEVAIPDEEAAVFSIAFYRELLLRGRCFGLAAHHARSHLLRQYGNPIGLAYSVYGNTDLAVTQQKAGN